MKYPKFISKEDWSIKTDFMGLAREKVIYKKGHIFEPDENGKYTIVDPYGAENLINEDSMREYKISFEDETPFFEIIQEEDNSL
jgi:hypothetical protein